MISPLLEVCVDSLDAAQIACASGADRLELCSVLDVGGVTPSAPWIRAIRSRFPIALVALIRCRAGDFVYSASEKEVMLEEASICLEAGVDAIAVGALTKEREIDLDFLKSILKLCQGNRCVFHRAFDWIADPKRGIDELCSMGLQRILTSGGPPRAEEGIHSLREFVDYAQGRIEILPAGGISERNALPILRSTGVRALHGSFREGKLPSRDAIVAVKSILNSIDR